MDTLNAQSWDHKPYHSLDYEMKRRFGHKVWKIPVNAGMTCPNRDGTISEGGCIFCSAGGSGDFALSPSLSVTEQLAAQERLLDKAPKGCGFIAYFQAFTNTYAPVSYLEEVFGQAIRRPEIEAVSIATRPDCLPGDVLSLLSDLNKIKPVWVELGLQTIHETSARAINRGYALPVFEQAVSDLRSEHLEVIVHTIFGLPGETAGQMLDTIRYLSHMDLQGIKLQLLHILRNTTLGSRYEAYGERYVHVLTMDEYIDLVIRALELLPGDIVIHRLTGDGPAEGLIAPNWSKAKRNVLNTLHHRMKEQQSWQGKSLHRPEGPKQQQ